MDFLFLWGETRSLLAWMRCGHVSFLGRWLVSKSSVCNFQVNFISLCRFFHSSVYLILVRVEAWWDSLWEPGFLRKQWAHPLSFHQWTCSMPNKSSCSNCSASGMIVKTAKSSSVVHKYFCLRINSTLKMYWGTQRTFVYVDYIYQYISFWELKRHSFLKKILFLIGE